MSWPARSYIAGVLLVGAALAGLALAIPAHRPVAWPLAALLLALATLYGCVSRQGGRAQSRRLCRG